ncbi:MAG TPA: CpsD/CapB family tyrosine-protein kinase [Methylomusa anaerophila]|uniref:non-specific protein-tyrosine kinase n=1 Tax=Methylomusa anaerophila TaxID=1930071 RepID=A0A348AGD3_9FIRM|nr:CpsD/CapB family tyrosine-protein kinase [Methylomusa anaerophila]BBB90131.1 tyrosine-protein kinase YwqD [Methylomusa anaerophila]HML88145.1 CpsD/CapB family tyrosine-protein kinase [Methylomusa anaerophila]
MASKHQPKHRASRSSSKPQLIMQEQAQSPVAEAYRTLRTNIQYGTPDRELKTIMFTSADPGAGKSTTAANTAVALAQAGKQVVLVDCDLRKPVQYRTFNQKNVGVTNILVEGTEVIVQDTYIANLALLPSGPIPPNPSELLGSAKMQQLLKGLKEKFDYVIVDSPPVVAVTDACVLASQVDGILLVMNSGTVRPEIAQKAKEQLLRANGHLLGVVLNRVEMEEEQAYYYYDYGNGKRQ